MTAEPFVSQLSDLCCRERTRAKWVIVPSHAVGLTLGDRLARAGTSWVNLRFVTPIDLAARMAAPFLVERGIDPSGDDIGPALVMRLLLEQPVEGGYFRPMAQHTSMAGALWRAIRELRYAGVRAAALESMPFTPVAGKQREFVALLRAFEQHLEGERIGDVAAIFEAAVRHLDWSPIAARDIVIEFPGHAWPPTVRQFLDALPGTTVAPCLLDIPALTLPARFAALSARSELAKPSSGTDAGRLRSLLAPADAGAPKDDGTLDIVCAGGRDAEIDEIFRRIAASGQPLDRVEIACSSGVQPSIAWEKALRLDWPVTVSSGLPAAMTRPGRLVLRVCDWIDSGYEAAELRRLLQSGDLGAETFDDALAAEADKPVGTTLSPGQAAKVLLKAEAAWGRETYDRALTRAADGYDSDAADQDASEAEREESARKATQARAFRRWVAAVLTALPDPGNQPDGLVPVTDLAAGVASFVEQFAGRSGSLDAMAHTAVPSALAELRALGGYRCELAFGVRFLRERVESLAVGRDRPRPGHLHVSTLHEVGYDGRPLVFVVGLEEGAVFPAAVEDAVLLDEERAAIGHRLQTSDDRQQEAVVSVLSRLAAIGASAEKVCLSYSCRDTREFRETFPSWIVLQAFRIQQGNATLTYDDLAKHFNEPVSSVAADPGSALTEAGWWLSVREAADARERILCAFPSLQQGLTAQAARDSDDFTEYDGFVPEAGAALDPGWTGRLVAPTVLEDAAKCPFRFFLRNGLGVRPIEESKLDADAWLSPATRGSEMHDLFARLMRAARDERRKVSLKVDQPRLQRWGRERIDALRVEMPPPSDEVFARESREFLDDLDAFIEAECEGRHGRDPIGFEVPFGFPGEACDEELAMDEPLEIKLDDKRTLRVRGRIDRVNRLGPGEYEVADYKGSYWPDDWRGAFAGGTRLQHAIYGMAAARAIRKQGLDAKPRVVRGTYLFPRLRGHRQKKEIAAPSVKKLQDVLRDLSNVIGGGTFVSADKESACTFCLYGAACGGFDLERVSRKVLDDDNVALRAFRTLRANHE
jgi:ATP-dependent helicase/nuclease subunit B